MTRNGRALLDYTNTKQNLQLMMHHFSSSVNNIQKYRPRCYDTSTALPEAQSAARIVKRNTKKEAMGRKAGINN
jgi:hypothetical protein